MLIVLKEVKEFFRQFNIPHKNEEVIFHMPQASLFGIRIGSAKISGFAVSGNGLKY
jgi:hypothetical protein